MVKASLRESLVIDFHFWLSALSRPAARTSTDVTSMLARLLLSRRVAEIGSGS
jgi:hypothetical protein